ncbi:hypothetical protein [Mycolicibacter sinensis]|uniref:Uncharacterized protein n=1 Tax=Mycolicibacter sinensis (strain JDM601) TaxID=875328 RepID=A0A1A2NHY4_MYCSD|nr:hypothetical protein [Mycolicibacter sinensis]OBH14696.1 hypothetical protein A5694_11875 [Mycolicibacter sinensis]OBI27456.1 hypothetical protein A5710_05580 [Mycolicibacter sinensis]
MTRLLAAASGTILAVAAIASAATAYADEPNDHGGQVSTQPAPGANLAGAVQPAGPGSAGPADSGAIGPVGGIANPGAAGTAHPGNEGAANPDGTARPAEEEPAHPGDDGVAAAPAAAGGMNSMGASIGTSMAMMAPMMAMYVPMLGAPMLLSGLGGLGAAPSTGAQAAAAAASDLAGSAAATDLPGSAAATDALGLPSSVASDLSNLDLTPNFDAGDLAGTTTDALASSVPSDLPLDAPLPTDLPDLDVTPLTDSLGDVLPGVAEAGAGVGTEAAGSGVCLGLAIIGLC